MATKKTTIAAEIKVDSSSAEKEVKDLKDGIQGVSTAAEGSIAQLKELKKQLKNTAAGSDEFKKLSAQIRDVEDGLENAKAGANDFAGALEQADGPVGMLGKGLRQLEIATSSWSAALKASGIGLLVSLVAGLAAAFAKNESAMKKLEPIMTQFGRILNGILGAMQPIIDGFIDLATRALPYVSKSFEVAYSALSSFLQGIGLVGSAVKKFISGDFTGAWDDAKKSVTEFGKRYEQANKGFIAGTKELTDKEKEEQAKRLADRKSHDEKMKALADKKAAEEKERLEKAKADAKAYEDFDTALQQRLIQIEDERIAKEKERLEKARADAKAYEDFDTALQQRLVQIDQEAAEKKKAADNAVTETKFQNAQLVVSILNNLNEIAGQNNAVSKGLALTQIAIDTAQAISSLTKHSEANPANTFTFGGAGVAQFLSGIARITANVVKAKNLLTQKAPSIPSFSGVSASPSVPYTSFAAPLSPTLQTTTLNQGQVNQIGNIAARAYVVESDVSGNQERITRLNRAARIN